ncbi:MAG: hypothetical protein B6U88_02595 [Candidatus Aenigmarchaeota archaeon ex4484_56]|nr:MAG: hypothetical protein B6U88_02595 [Candidatus Aenigmarchaeota archaeon ex4484_56]
MDLPFLHKKGEEASISIPIDEVRKLRAQGRSDREIIVELKNKGYSFQAIEKAMLQVLKSGVEANYPTNQISNEVPSPQIHEEKKIPTREELTTTRAPLVTTQQPSLQIPVQSFESDFGSPTDLIEEVVEGVVEEKFTELDEKFEEISKNQEKLKENIEAIKNLFVSSIKKRDIEINNIRNEFNKFSEDLEDIIIKYNALEKAFKQFLPELTEKAREEKIH